MNIAAQVDALLAGPRPLPIVTAGHPVLRRTADRYDGQLPDDMLAELIEAMRLTMYAAPGVGLAAPQIGIGMQLAVLEDPGTSIAEIATVRHRYPLPFRVIVNPEYTPVGDARPAFYEGCLSVPGYQAVVARPGTVLLRCTDATGASVEEEISGWAARIVQHETDHLHGTLYLDKALTRSLTDNEQYLARWSSADPAPARAVLDF